MGPNDKFDLLIRNANVMDAGGKVYLKHSGTVVTGVAFGRPHQVPFTVCQHDSFKTC